MGRLRPTISTSDPAHFLAEAGTAVDAVLARWALAVYALYPGAVGEAIVYALEGAGKRLRPSLMLAVYAEAGGQGDATELGAAVEVVHTYSLVHDDLPSMDDDDLRRGRPTVHRVHGVAAATAAGLHMVSLAARIVAAGCARLELDVRRTGDIAATLFRAAGLEGMVAGQVLDLEAEGQPVSAEELTRVHRAKTGALLAASTEIGAVAAGLTGDRRAAAWAFGAELGLAFQIVDDVLDAVGDSAQLGKTAGKDARQHKATSVGLLGHAGAVAAAGAARARAMDHLRAAGLDSERLAGLTRLVVERQS